MAGYSLRDRTAPARRTDPVESFAGPSSEARSAHQRIVLSILGAARGALSDEQIEASARARGYSDREVTGQSLRSRRAELCALGVVQRVGSGINSKGNKCGLFALPTPPLVQGDLFGGEAA